MTIFLLLGAMRRVHVPATSLRAGQWRGQMSLGHDPDGKTLGILGMGGIGSAVARRALAFDFKLQYHNRSPLSPERNPLGAVYVDFETLLKTSDVISVHLPLGEETRGMIGEKEFHLMKNGVVLINTARGAIIDEKALVGAIQSGKVFGAGLDVYENEPEVNQELMDNDNVVLLPHLGTATIETQVRLFLFSSLACAELHEDDLILLFPFFSCTPCLGVLCLCGLCLCGLDLCRFTSGGFACEASTSMAFALCPFACVALPVWP